MLSTAGCEHQPPRLSPPHSAPTDTHLPAPVLGWRGVPAAVSRPALRTGAQLWQDPSWLEDVPGAPCLLVLLWSVRGTSCMCQTRG